jgi:hypothetical protein
LRHPKPQTIVRVFWILALAAATHAAALPRLELADKHLLLVNLPDLPGEDGVRPHLDTGLTTSFVFRLSFRGPQGERIFGGGRVDIRYEVWDEVYHVEQWGIDGGYGRREIPSFEALGDYWRQLRLVVLGASPAAGGGGVRLEIDLVPFSQKEREDARRWFSESLERAGRSNAEALTGTTDEPPEKLGRAFNLLMATSIKRRPLESWRFELAWPAEDIL